MPNCDFCSLNPPTSAMTRCCKSIMCAECRDKLSKKLSCICGKILPVGKKNYLQSPEILEYFSKLTQRKGRECDRCEARAQVDCVECEMMFCRCCNQQMHEASGFAKHQRKKVTEGKFIDKSKRNSFICGVHKLPIINGCECGSGLCQNCNKIHKENCQKGVKCKNLKEFKDEYFCNVLTKIRQLSQFKQKLIEDKTRYNNHFHNQKQSFEGTQKLIFEQFEYLQKMIEIKYSQVKTKLAQYWSKCEKVYLNNLFKISEQIVKYDEYAQLIQIFSQNLTNLQFFDRKIKRFPINLDFIHLKVSNIDVVQSSILNISFTDKPLEQFGAEIGSQNIASNSVKQQYKILDIQNASQLIMEYTNNPLSSRQLTMMPSHNEILFNFIHLPYQNSTYELQYGLGIKIKGTEEFKKITNNSGYGLISNLKSDTKYRIRMRVKDGVWGLINEIRTLNIPRFNLQGILYAKSISQNSIQIIKGGIIYGTNQIHFGVHKWILKMTSKSITYQENETACVSVGVGYKNNKEKQSKKAIFVGTTLNYGYQKNEIVIKMCLDCNEKKLTITNLSHNQEETYQNLPGFPLFPAIQNKGNGQILVRYSLTMDQSNQC